MKIFFPFADNSVWEVWRELIRKIWGPQRRAQHFEIFSEEISELQIKICVPTSFCRDASNIAELLTCTAMMSQSLWHFSHHIAEIIHSLMNPEDETSCPSQQRQHLLLTPAPLPIFARLALPPSSAPPPSRHPLFIRNAQMSIKSFCP